MEWHDPPRTCKRKGSLFYYNGKLRIPIVRMMVNSIKGYNPIYPYIYLLYHLESRWRNSHVLVYHSPLPSHLLGVAQSTFTTVYMGGSISSPYHPPKPGPASFNAFSFRFASEIMWFKPGVWSVGHGLSWWVGEPSHPKVWAIFFFLPQLFAGKLNKHLKQIVESKHLVNVGKYTSPMDPMGRKSEESEKSLFSST